MKSTNCQACGKPFDYTPHIIDGRERFIPTICNPCDAIRADAARQEEREAKKKATMAAWDAICPSLYSETDVYRLPDAYCKAIHAWRYSRKGVGFVGDPGLGKTRAAFEILRKEHFAGRNVFAISAKRLGDRATEKFDDHKPIKIQAREDLQRCRVCDLLLIDDIGKGKFTERGEEELYDLLETRTSSRRPTIWTANSTGAELLSKLSADRGEAILRRLVDFSEIL